MRLETTTHGVIESWGWWVKGAGQVLDGKWLTCMVRGQLPVFHNRNVTVRRIGADRAATREFW